MSEINGNGIWKIIATGLIMGITGWFVRTTMSTDIIPEKRNSTSTGWSKDQEQKFLWMPTGIDTVIMIERRIESDFAILRKLLHR